MNLRRGIDGGTFLPSIIVILFLFAASVPVAFAQNQVAPLATLQVTKSIHSVSADDVATLRLVVMNNGTVPVFDIEIFEYMNTALLSASDIQLTAPDGQNTIGLPTGGFGTPAQVIVDPPPPASLQPGQRLSLEYKMHAPHPGDFQIPASLAWFSYLHDKSTIRSNYYSNGLTLHIPGGIERVIIIAFPFVISAATFMVTITILLWARGRLRKGK